jgi:hypothetical protein
MVGAMSRFRRPSRCRTVLCWAPLGSLPFEILGAILLGSPLTLVATPALAVAAAAVLGNPSTRPTPEV